MTSKAKAKTPSRPVESADDFASVAKRLECDENLERFDATLKKIAKAKPEGPSK